MRVRWSWGGKDEGGGGMRRRPETTQTGSIHGYCWMEALDGGMGNLTSLSLRILMILASRQTQQVDNMKVLSKH